MLIEKKGEVEVYVVMPEDKWVNASDESEIYPLFDGYGMPFTRLPYCR